MFIAIENCLKHIKACIKEARNQMNIYLNDLSTYLQIYSKRLFQNKRSDNIHLEINIKLNQLRSDMETLCSLGDKLISIMGNNLRSLRTHGIPLTMLSARTMEHTNRHTPFHLNYHSKKLIQLNDFEILSKLPSILIARRSVTDELIKLNDLENSEIKKYLKLIEMILLDYNYPIVKSILKPRHLGK